MQSADLDVLPSTRASAVGSDEAGAEAVVTEGDTVNSGEHLPWAGAGIRTLRAEEDALAPAQLAERRELLEGPASVDGVLASVGGVGLGELDLAVGGDVDLLAARHVGAQTEGVLTASEEGLAVADGALDLAWLVGGGLLADPEVKTVGVDALEVDRRGGVSGDDAEG